MPRPRLNAFDSSEPLLRTTNAANAARRHITGFWEGFVDFAFNDNVLHVAIGLMYVPLSAVPCTLDHLHSLHVTHFLAQSLTKTE